MMASRNFSILGVCFALCSAPAWATDVNVIGLFSNKAVVVINRGQPKTMSVGDATPEGVKLIAVDHNGATLEIDGKRQTLEMGQHFATAPSAGGGNKVTLAPDSRGHFITDGQVNGVPMRFLVDTGASVVAMSVSDARRIGIDYMKGERGYSIVADGRRVPAYRVKLDSVTVGDITVFGVEASVTEGSMGVALLGMSFLNRMEMQRDSQSLTLIKRY
jgi:aspartyl protease family protein